MRLLCVSDIHGRYNNVVKLLHDVKGYDVAVLSGDITHLGDYGESESIISLFLSVGEDLGAKTIAVPGNMDRQGVLRFLEDKGISLNGNGLIWGNIGFMGIGGSNKTPFSTPNELSDTDMLNLLNEGYEKIENADIKVLVSHAPPKKTKIDKSFMGLHAGSEVIKNFIEKHDIDLCICGHIHEAKGEDRLGKCICVNPGPLKDGYYAFVDIEKTINVTWRKI